MKKIRNKIIIMLVIISLTSQALSYLLTTPLVEEFLSHEATWVLDLIKNALQSSFSLIIFTLFVIGGVREITRPVLLLTDMATRIADGDYSVEIPVSKRRDEIGQLEQSFAVMVKELRSTEHMQKDFASNVSHEFKTPLSVIQGYARLLGEDTLTAEERRQYSEFIMDEATRLSAMTSNILLLSRLENKGIQPAMSTFSLDEQLRQAALLNIAAWQEKNIALDIDAPEIAITANEDMLMHVWVNLLGNAIKYSNPDGQITVQAKADAGYITVSIADTGIGMDAEVVSHIFDQFYQGDPSRQNGGAGLGLTLVKRIVEVHGGNLRVASTPGEGSVFSVMLPAGASTSHR